MKFDAKGYNLFAIFENNFPSQFDKEIGLQLSRFSKSPFLGRSLTIHTLNSNLSGVICPSIIALK